MLVSLRDRAVRRRWPTSMCSETLARARQGVDHVGGSTCRGAGGRCRCAPGRRCAGAGRPLAAAPPRRARRPARRAGGLPQVRPALAAVVDVVEVEAGLVEEPAEVDVGSLAAQRAQLVDLRRPARRDGVAEAAQHDLGSPSASSCMWQPAGRNGNCSARPARRRAGCRRAAPGSDGRTGTPCGACRRSRARCRTPCPGRLAAARGRAAGGTAWGSRSGAASARCRPPARRRPR